VSNPAALLRAESFSHHFKDRRILVSASLRLCEHRITAVFGRNGSGKSTLFRAISGLLRAQRGVLSFDGRVYESPRLHELARAGLFYIPERGLLSPLLTLRRQLGFFAPGKNSAEHLNDVAAQLELTPLLDHFGNELSPGERIRARFAFALLRKPRCLLADEPFLGIAPRDGEHIAAAIRHLAASGAAVAVTGHEIETLFELADDIVWLTGGTTHALGSSTAARQNSHFRREYLARD
jgi:ABC-type multidrug transport system ATPase subunit